MNRIRQLAPDMLTCHHRHLRTKHLPGVSKTLLTRQLAVQYIIQPRERYAMGVDFTKWEKKLASHMHSRVSLIITWLLRLLSICQCAYIICSTDFFPNEKTSDTQHEPALFLCAEIITTCYYYHTRGKCTRGDCTRNTLLGGNRSIHLQTGRSQCQLHYSCSHVLLLLSLHGNR